MFHCHHPADTAPPRLPAPAPDPRPVLQRRRGASNGIRRGNRTPAVPVRHRPMGLSAPQPGPAATRPLPVEGRSAQSAPRRGALNPRRPIRVRHAPAPAWINEVASCCSPQVVVNACSRRASPRPDVTGLKCPRPYFFGIARRPWCTERGPEASSPHPRRRPIPPFFRPRPATPRPSSSRSSPPAARA